MEIVMKRDYTQLSLCELTALRTELDELCREKGSLVSQRFFAEAEDVFLTHVLEPLARTLNILDILPLRLVCKCWAVTVCRVSHLATWSPSKNVHSLFGQLTSLDVNSVVLIANIQVTSPRITHLAISDMGTSRRGAPYHLQASLKWPGLTALCVPHCARRIMDLEYCVQLTELDTTVDAFGTTPDALYRLTKLRRLRIRGFAAGGFEPTRLPHLQWLDSDWVSHFTGYTGRGLCDSEDMVDGNGSDDPQDRVETAARRLLLPPQTLDIRLAGEWTEGRFTGRAQYTHWIDNHVGCRFDGAFIENRRHSFVNACQICRDTCR